MTWSNGSTHGVGASHEWVQMGRDVSPGKSADGGEGLLAKRLLGGEDVQRPADE
jgi:hypothetical protein